MPKRNKPGPGHNNPPKDKPSKKAGKVTTSDKQIRSLVKRIERLTEEKVALSADISEIYAEAKGNGFDTKVLRALIQRRKRDAAELEEMEAVLDLYEHAMGAE